MRLVGRGALLCAVVTLAIGAGLPDRPPPASAQQAIPCDQEEHEYGPVQRPKRYRPMPQEIVSIPSRRDGAAIQIGIVRPRMPGGKRVPVIVEASPYYHPMQTLDLRACQPRLTETFVPRGYAVAFVAVRGTADSGGCMDMFGPGERADLDTAVSWLASRPWSTGAVGMTGLSYAGGTPWEVAAFGNRHLKTIAPVEGVPDLFDLLFAHGTPDWRGPALLNDLYYAQSVAFYLAGRSPDHTLEVTACPDYATANAAALFSAQTGELDPFGYWAARRFRDRIERRYRGSVMLVQGLQDWNVNPGLQFPWIQRLERRGVFVKKLLGQWGHSFPDEVDPPERRPDYNDLLLNWFDRWLKGREVRVGPRAEVQDSQGRWRRESDWPPPSERRTFWATADGRLADAPGGGAEGRTLTLDPLHTQGGGLVENDPPHPLQLHCGPPNCARFDAPRFSKRFHFAGLPLLRLEVTPSAPAGQISAYLYAAGDSGATRLGWGQADLRFPRGESEAQPIEPGRAMEVHLRLQPLDAVVPTGQQLVLVLSQGTAYNRLPSLPNAPVALAVGGRSSSLRLRACTPTPMTSSIPTPSRPGQARPAASWARREPGQAPLDRAVRSALALRPPGSPGSRPCAARSHPLHSTRRR